MVVLACIVHERFCRKRRFAVLAHETSFVKREVGHTTEPLMLRSIWWRDRLNIFDGSSSRTKIGFARDESIGASVSMKTSGIGQPSCPYRDDALSLYRFCIKNLNEDTSRLWKNWGHEKTSMVLTGAQQKTGPAGCSKRSFSKAAASEEARRTIRYVEPLSDARTPPGEKRVSARRGWAGEKSGLFSILLCCEELLGVGRRETTEFSTVANPI